MAKNLLNRYVWLIDTIHRYGRITQKELSDLWQRNEKLSVGNPLPRRTFHAYRKAIEEMFDVNIECDTSTYEYYIEDEGELLSGNVNHWLLDTFAVNSMLDDSRQLNGRILLENVPSGRKFLTVVIEAMKSGRELSLVYRPYSRQEATGMTLEPYFVKVFKQRWYVIGRNGYDGRIKTYALDRVLSMEISERKFVYPAGFDAEAYFDHCFGIMQSDEEPQEVVIAVSEHRANYFRALPLHRSQQESGSFGGRAVFRYRLKITFDLLQELLSYGDDLQVMAPPSLRDRVAAVFRSSAALYGK